MIDVCQWRASIGSWNCCQAATGRRSHNDGDGGSVPTRDWSSGRNKAPVLQASAVDLISFIVFFILLFCASKLTATGRCTSFQLFVGDDISKWLQLYVGASAIGSFNLFTVSFNLYFYFLLILLSGDVELNPGPVTDASSLLRSASAELTKVISTTLYTVTDLLYAQGLIPLDVKREMYFKGETDEKKAGRLLITLQALLEASSNPKQYLINVCYILLSQKLVPLKEITAPILKDLGEPISDNQKLEVTIILPPDDVQEYADILRQRYNRQPIIAKDWPPRVGKDFFGRLTLIEGQIKQTESLQVHWHMLRGEVDKIPDLTGNEEIKMEDLLKTEDTSSQNIVIDGPPGIGKTTLCRKLLNMWSNGVLGCLFDLVLYCPLRNSEVAEAKELEELFLYVYDSPNVPEIVKWVKKEHGKGLLIIFDGWDELSMQHRESSLVAKIICKKKLANCSVIVTSRSYASASLLKIMVYVSKQFQIIGLSTKEISTVIINTIQKDSDLAEKLIDENRYTYDDKYFKTTQYNKDSQRAVKLINELKVRGDVQSLCYIPLVCSMVILVYCKEGGQLPTTLTQLYENFILQTIRRHVERKRGTDPQKLVSLNKLPSTLHTALQELSELAYATLAETKITFSLYELNLSMDKAAKEDYLGLLTSFEDYDEEKHQFLHLSIQEFLAAWWIFKHDNTEIIFNDYFDNEHFRMCLRFVAGLTRLENESYRQYFEKKIDLQCKKTSLKVFEMSHHHWFYERLDVSSHVRSVECEELQILLLQLLYESQSSKLCQIFAQSIENSSLCLNRFTLFDWLCLGYFSNIKWHRLDLEKFDRRSLSVLTDSLSFKSVSECSKLQIHFPFNSDYKIVMSLLRKPLFYYIQELKFIFKYNTCDWVLLLSELVTLPKLEMLYLEGGIITDLIDFVDKCTELEEHIKTAYISRCSKLEQRIKTSSQLQELVIIIDAHRADELIKPFVASVTKGIMQNDKMKSFTLKLDDPFNYDHFPLDASTIENLAKNSDTLQALSIDIPNNFIPSPMNRIEVKSKLTALKIANGSVLVNSFLPCIEGLKCLVLPMPYPPCLIFESYPDLQQLTLQLDTAESINELFTILQTNTTLKALRVEVEVGSIFTICTIGRSDSNDFLPSYMRHTYKIKNYKKCMSASSYMSTITTGIMHNTGLQQLSIPVYLPITNKEMRAFFDVLSQKDITELEVNFNQDQTCSFQDDEIEMMKPFFYEQTPVIFDILGSHKTIKTMSIVCEYLRESCDTNTTAIEDLFHRTSFQSLQQLEIKRAYSSNMRFFPHAIDKVVMCLH